MKIKKLIKDNYRKYLLFTLTNLISAINFNLLLKPINLVAGGSPGLSLIVKQIVPISPSDIITIIYILTFVLCFLLLDKKYLIGIIYGSIIYPLFVNLTGNVTSLITLEYQDILLIACLSGIISGICNGLTYRNGFASGGLGVIGPIMNKHFKVSISLTNFVLNTIIVLLGGYFYGINTILYALILLYLSSYVCNMIILGVSKNKVLYIKSKKEEKIKALLNDKYGLKIAMLKDEVHQDNLILVVMKNNVYHNVKNDIMKVDQEVFFTTDNCYEVK